MLKKAFSADVSLSGDREVIAKISTAVKDRDAEVLIPQGCDSSEFEANPAVFWNHSYDLPVGKCTGIRRTNDAVVAKMQFAERPAAHPEGEEWLPDTLLSLYKQKVLAGFSVGFIPVSSRMPNEKDIKQYGDGVRRIHSNWKLLEFSAVSLPANPEAVALAVSKGLVSQKSAFALFGELPSLPRPALKRVYVLPAMNNTGDIIRREIARARGQLVVSL